MSLQTLDGAALQNDRWAVDLEAGQGNDAHSLTSPLKQEDCARARFRAQRQNCARSRGAGTPRRTSGRTTEGERRSYAAVAVFAAASAV